MLPSVCRLVFLLCTYLCSIGESMREALQHRPAVKVGKRNPDKTSVNCLRLPCRLHRSDSDARESFTMIKPARAGYSDSAAPPFHPSRQCQWIASRRGSGKHHSPRYGSGPVRESHPVLPLRAFCAAKLRIFLLAHAKILRIYHVPDSPDYGMFRNLCNWTESVHRGSSMTRLKVESMLCLYCSMSGTKQGCRYISVPGRQHSRLK